MKYPSFYLLISDIPRHHKKKHVKKQMHFKILLPKKSQGTSLSAPKHIYSRKRKENALISQKKKKPFRLLTKTKIQEKTKSNSTHIQIKPKQI